MGFMRKLFIIVLIVSLVLSVSAVVAGDNITDDDLGVDLENEVILSHDAGESETPLLAAGDDFESVQNMVDSAKAGDTIYLEGKTFKGNGKTIMVNKPITLVGGFHEGDNVNATFDAQKQSRIMVINASDVTLKGIKFINGSATDSGYPYYGNSGAIYVEKYNDNVSAVGCTFVNNSAGFGGAMFGGSAVGCVFEGNSASDFGGAMNGGSAVNCTFVVNSASMDGGAMSGGSAVGCVFEGNSASMDGGAMSGGSAVNCSFSGNSASDFGGAMFGGSAVGCVFEGNSASASGGAMFSGSAVGCVFEGNSASMDGGAMFSGSAVGCVFEGNSAGFGGAMFDVCYLNCHGQEEDYYGCEELILLFDVKDFTSTYSSNKALPISLKNQNGVDVMFINVGVVIFKDGVVVRSYSCLSGDRLIFDLATGNYTAELKITYPNLEPKPTNITLTINKATPTITAVGITATYKINKDFVITLTDSIGNPLVGEKITVSLNGAKNYITDKNGQVKVSTKGLAPRTYTATITFAGNNNYVKSTASAKVTVTKATPKLTAKAKTFKKSVKTKKYTITLKDNQNKAMKKAKVTLKIKGKKAMTVKTNAKGKATFKIKKLTKKGKYKATVTYKGNNCYNKVTQKVTIKIK